MSTCGFPFDHITRLFCPYKSTEDYQELTDHSIIDDSSTLTSMDPFSFLPRNVIQTIFSFLKAKELATSCLVNKRWCQLASHVALCKALNQRNFFPSLKVNIFDESDWATHVDLPAHGLSINDAPPLDSRKALPLLKKCISSLPSIEKNAGVTILAVPKDLTFNELVKLAESPKVGQATQIKLGWEDISKNIGNIPVDKTYWIVTTNNVFEGSRALSASDQNHFVEKIGCKRPLALEAALLLWISHMKYKERLYPSKTYTSCSDKVNGHQLIVGGFESNFFEPDSFVIDGDDSINTLCGVAGSYVLDI